MSPRPLVLLRPPCYQVACCLLSTTLLVWSSCFLSLFPTHRRHLSRVKAEQKKVPYWRRKCVLLMRSWQVGLLARSPPLGFEQTWPKGRRLLASLLASGTSSSFLPCIRSHHLPSS